MSTPTQLVQLSYGREVFEKTVIRLASLAMKPPNTSEFPSKVFGKSGSSHRVPCSPYPEAHGSIISDHIQIPDGQVLGFRSSHVFNMLPTRDGIVFIRTRANGALYSIDAKLSGNMQSTIGSYVLMGVLRGDLMDLDDLKAMGFRFSRSYVEQYMTPEEVEECFEITILEPEIAPAPKIEILKTRRGEQLIVAAKPNRRVRHRSED